MATPTNDLSQAKALIQQCRETQTPYLDLGNCGITDLNDLPELFECDHLQTLILSNEWWDYEQRQWIKSNNSGAINYLKAIPSIFARLSKLSTLKMGGKWDNRWQITDIRFLEKLSNLQSLDLSYNQITDIRFLEKLSNLQSLDLRENQITDIRFLDKLSNLQTLDLRYNQITDYRFLEKLSNLQTLYLRDNQITDYRFLEKLSNLQSLDLRSNQITDIRFLDKLSNLQNLYLSYNQITDIRFLDKLSNLHTLDLRDNQITDISFLDKLSNLHTLDLRDNQITDISLEKLTNLQSLELSGNKITNIYLTNLVALQSLNLSNHSISNIFLEKLSNLQSLDLRSNQITDIRFLDKLSNLQNLYLRENQITDIRFLEKLSNLQSLDLCYNQITDIRFLEKLSNLQSLDLSYNQITDIRFLEKLSNLQSLDLRYNQITDIRFLEKLSNLQSLYLNDNKIKEIPLSIFQLELEIHLKQYSLKGLSLYGNPIASPPMEILKQGRQAVLEWFAAEKIKLNEIKIILIGDPKAGKTSLLRRLKSNTFSESEPQTDGVNIEDIHFGECNTFQQQTELHPITGHFWDFGGQEIMNATHQFFLTSRSVYILVLDARKDTNVAGQIRQWLKRVTATGGNSPIIVVANQIDVNRGFGFENEYELQKEFPQVKYFIKASCKTEESIDFIKDKLAELIPQAEFFQSTEIDERWMALKDKLQEKTKSDFYLNEDIFLKMCSECRLENNSQKYNAITFLHDLGLVLHFDEVKSYDYYVLDPYWITYGVYQILTSGLAGESNGVVPMEKLEYIINDEPEKSEQYQAANYQKIRYTNQQSRFLLEILNAFKLCFKVPDGNSFIIPDLLDTEEPKAFTQKLRDSADSIRFVYEYEYLPRFVMPHLIVETHRFHKKIWRTGCVLQDNGCEALVSNYDNRLSIIVCGDHKKKREFMAVIRNRIDSINQELSDKPKMLIPLDNKNAFADYEVLLNRERKGKKVYIFDEDKPTEKGYQISELLDGIPSLNEVSEMSKKIDLVLKNQVTIVDNQEIIIGKLDAHYDYLIELPTNQSIKKELAPALGKLDSQQIAVLSEEFTTKISEIFAQHNKQFDGKWDEIYNDLHLVKNTGVKLKLSVPFINMLGIDLGIDFDVKKWTEQMIDKYEDKRIVKIFKLARGRDISE